MNVHTLREVNLCTVTARFSNKIAGLVSVLSQACEIKLCSIFHCIINVVMYIASLLRLVSSPEFLY